MIGAWAWVGNELSEVRLDESRRPLILIKRELMTRSTSFFLLKDRFKFVLAGSEIEFAHSGDIRSTFFWYPI